MSDSAYQFSQFVFRAMERFFLWAYNLLHSGALDFFIHNWVKVALFLSILAVIIDQLLYFLTSGHDSPTVRVVTAVWGGCQKGYHWVRQKIDPGHTRLLSQESFSQEGDRTPTLQPDRKREERYEAAEVTSEAAPRRGLSWQEPDSGFSKNDTATFAPIQHAANRTRAQAAPAPAPEAPEAESVTQRPPQPDPVLPEQERTLEIAPHAEREEPSGV